MGVKFDDVWQFDPVAPELIDVVIEDAFDAVTAFVDDFTLEEIQFDLLDQAYEAPG